MKWNRSESSRTRNNILFGVGLIALVILIFRLVYSDVDVGCDPLGAFFVYKGLWDVLDAEYFGRYQYKEKYFSRPWFSRFHRLDGAIWLLLGLLTVLTQCVKRKGWAVLFFGILIAVCLLWMANWYYHCVILENKSETKE